MLRKHVKKSSRLSNLPIFSNFHCAVQIQMLCICKLRNTTLERLLWQKLNGKHKQMNDIDKRILYVFMEDNKFLSCHLTLNLFLIKFYLLYLFHSTCSYAFNFFTRFFQILSFAAPNEIQKRISLE